MVGAVLGGLAAYMFFTERGRAWRRQLEPQLDDLMRELHEFRATVARASSVAGQGWRLLNEAIQEHATEREQVGDIPYARSTQSHPF
jgi:hypothetical protein